MPVEKCWAIKLGYQEWLELTQCKFKTGKGKKKQNCLDKKGKGGTEENLYRPKQLCSKTYRKILVLSRQ